MTPRKIDVAIVYEMPLNSINQSANIPSTVIANSTLPG